MKIMERVMAPKNSIFTNLKDTYQVVRSRPNFKVYPQMPVSQIQHYVKQVARREKIVTIQLNPSTQNRQMTEISGNISLSPTSSHVILKTEDQQTVHLIQPQHIRHLRLYSS
jgi:23S rRNA U2552 (ribose-2'-O)-methylase RlmE/FtsJ